MWGTALPSEPDNLIWLETPLSHPPAPSHYCRGFQMQTAWLATHQLCDLRQVTAPVCASVSLPEK